MKDIHAKKTDGYEEEDIERETCKEYGIKNILRRKGIKGNEAEIKATD
jgi:hypothetical protein